MTCGTMVPHKHNVIASNLYSPGGGGGGGGRGDGEGRHSFIGAIQGGATGQGMVFFTSLS